MQHTTPRKSLSKSLTARRTYKAQETKKRISQHSGKLEVHMHMYRDRVLSKQGKQAAQTLAKMRHCYSWYHVRIALSISLTRGFDACVHALGIVISWLPTTLQLQIPSVSHYYYCLLSISACVITPSRQTPSFFLPIASHTRAITVRRRHLWVFAAARHLHENAINLGKPKSYKAQSCLPQK